MTENTQCTTILVGKEMMADNSMIVARSADSNALVARHLKIYKDTDNGAEKFEAIDSTFKCKLIARTLGKCGV